MQILSVHLVNIKSHRDTELHFSEGINVLSGPNGIGKSTIFEAIGYALFGVDARSFVGNVDRFVTIGAKRGSVEVSFRTDAGESFRVSRTAGAPPKWLLAREIDGQFEVEEHKDAAETEERLRNLLGLDNGRSLAEQFELVIGPFQNDFLGPFVIRQATRRRDRFDEILGIDTWRKTFQETKALSGAIKAKVEALESALVPLREQAGGLPEKERERETALTELEQADRTLKEQKAALRDLEVSLAAFDRREQRVRSLRVEIEKLQDRLESGREKIAVQKLLVEEADAARRVLAETRAGKAAFEKAEALLAELGDRAKNQRRLELEAASLDKEVGRLTERWELETGAVAEAEEELSREEKALAEGRKQVEVDTSARTLAERLPEIRTALDALRLRLGQLEGLRSGLAEGQEKLAEGVCPFFGEPCLNLVEQSPRESFSERLDELESERAQRNRDLEKLHEEEKTAAVAWERLQAWEVQSEALARQEEQLLAKRSAMADRAGRLRTLREEKEELGKRLAGKREALKGFDELQTLTDEALAEKKRHQEARDRYLANQRQAEDLERRREALENYQALFRKLEEQSAGKNEELLQAGREYDAEVHESLRTSRGELSQAVGALGERIEGLHGRLERLAGEIARLKAIQEEIAEKQARIRAYGEKEELVGFLRNRVFRNVSSSLSERFREEIGQRADRIYRTIAETDEELCWGEDYRIVLRDMVDDNFRERSDDQLSGGQTMSAVVALRLALLQTIGARVAFFDEPTSNLDAARRENLARAFRAIDVGKEEVTEHWYDQLFLISHDVAFAEVTDQTHLLDEKAQPVD